MTRRHRLIVWARHRPHLVAYLLIAGGAATGVWRVEATASEAQRTADAVHELVLDNEAARCVISWDRLDDIRRAIPIPGEAIIAVSPDADPARVAEFRAAVDARIREAYPNPDCDLDAARRRLAD
jgi:hypothetical protein